MVVPIRESGSASKSPESPSASSFVVDDLTFVLPPRETRRVVQARVFAEPSAAGLERKLNEFLAAILPGDLVSVTPSFSHQSGQTFYIAIALYVALLTSGDGVP